MEDMTREQERMRERELRRRAPSPPACPHYTDGEVTLFTLSLSPLYFPPLLPAPPYTDGEV